MINLIKRRITFNFIFAKKFGVGIPSAIKLFVFLTSTTIKRLLGKQGKLKTILYLKKVA